MFYTVFEPYELAAVARLRASPVLRETSDLALTEIALVRSRTRIDANFLKRSPRLRLVVTATSGFDHVDWRLCQTAGVAVTHTPEANAAATAELTLLLMLAISRDLTAAIKNVRGHRWRQDLTRPAGLIDRTLGVVGLGRVGTRVLNLARAFGMKVQAHDPYASDARFEAASIPRAGFTELLRSSDYVSLHVPLTRETKHLLNQPTFLEMQRESYLINACRGPVVDENDLLTALDANVIAGAAIDVIEREPPPAGHRLLTHPRLLMTPHVGAHTSEAWARASAEAVNQAEAFARGAKLADTLPLETPWFSESI